MEKKKRIVLSVVDMAGKAVEELELDPVVFDSCVKKAPLYQVIVGYRANKRLGCAATKTRGEVSGGGKKPWRQKGTGRARHGSIRSPLWRHGGVVFGPHPRDFSQHLPVKLRTEALRSSLNAKINSGNFLLVEKVHLLHPKTKDFVKFLTALKLKDQTVLCVIDAITENIKRAARNIRELHLTDGASLNALDVLNSKKIVMSRDSLKTITKRLKDV